MALLKFTNPSSTATVVIDVDSGDRDDRYSKFRIAPSGTICIDEADVNPYIGEGAECNSIPYSLKSGILTVTESDIDNITDLTKKNFIASGLGIKYFYASTSVVAKNVCVLDSNGKLAFDATAGNSVNLGVVRKDSSTGEYVRTYVDAVATVVAGETITAGDKVAGSSNGSVKKVDKVGQYYVGTALASATIGQQFSITVAPGKIESVVAFVPVP